MNLYYLLIYLSGIIITFIVCKVLRNHSNNNDWGDVGLTIFASLLSFFGLLYLLFVVLVHRMYNRLEDHKPPKWL
jgi:hypothetical protein